MVVKVGFCASPSDKGVCVIVAALALEGVSHVDRDHLFVNWTVITVHKKFLLDFRQNSVYYIWAIITHCLVASFLSVSDAHCGMVVLFYAYAARLGRSTDFERH